MTDQTDFLNLLGAPAARPTPAREPEPAADVDPALVEFVDAAILDTLPADVPTWICQVADAGVFTDDGVVIYAEVLAFDGRMHAILIDRGDAGDRSDFFFLPEPGPTPWPRMSWNFRSQRWDREPNSALTDDGLSRADLEEVNPWMRQLP